MVDGRRRFADAKSLEPVVRTALGTHRKVTEVERLSGGSKKGVYRVVVDDGMTVIIYVWNSNEDYWHEVLPEGAEDPADPFSHASGLDLFEAAAQRLTGIGVRCPRLLLADRSGARYPGDVAVVEHVAGDNLEAVLEHDSVLADRAMEVVARWLASMQACRAPKFGKIAVADAGRTSHGESCPQVVLARALLDVDEISASDPRAARQRGRLRELLHTLAEPIKPRSWSTVVHGELGPDHILLDAHGEPVLIDIEGVMYFDVEWEHVFLRMRFSNQYSRLRNPELDAARLRLYQLAQHLNLVAGPLRIAGSGHPDRDWFLDIAEYHLRKALAFG